MSRKAPVLRAIGAAGVAWAVLLGAAYSVGFKQVSALRAKGGVGEAEAGNVAKTDREISSLRRKLDALKPKGIHIVIDSGANRLFLKRGDEVIREAVISCGSGGILVEPGGKKRTWIFDTPRGEFHVKSKITNPYWVKPDWAFIEEGEPIPDNPEARVEAGTLGDYALGFGDGYFIHGTLYSRLLGRNVTHGCVRVGDEDLKAVFRAVPIGAKIYIY
jgi:lipoprotein-anchoring transpeptidase ErfK/SrfK